MFFKKRARALLYSRLRPHGRSASMTLLLLLLAVHFVRLLVARRNSYSSLQLLLLHFLVFDYIEPFYPAFDFSE